MNQVFTSDIPDVRVRNHAIDVREFVKDLQRLDAAIST